MRQPGWYWVKVDDTADWEPCDFTGGWWFVPDDTGGREVADSYFYRIHEHRIEEPIEEELPSQHPDRRPALSRGVSRWYSRSGLGARFPTAPGTAPKDFGELLTC